jgi:hypothetical protein
MFTNNISILTLAACRPPYSLVLASDDLVYT